MRSPEPIRRVFKKFDGIALETLTKAWRYPQQPETYQRTVPLIKEQHETYKTAGNCFDLSLWLYESFQHEGISAYFIGESIGTPDAHVAVLAQDEKGFNYYCDLGDQWIEPILVDARSEAFTEEIQYGFFPGANISIKADEKQFQVTHHRPNGKKSAHSYSLEPVSHDEFMEAAEYSQTLLRAPLVETRFYNKYYDEVVHWEFNQGESFMSTTKGLIKDEPPENMEEQVERIHAKTGMDLTIIRDALTAYANKMTKRS